MDMREYLEQVTGQMRCKKARDMVAQELQDHIEDQTETYEHFGLSKEEARIRAVEQMGDPIEVGTAMDRIHRPRINYRMIAFIAVLTVFGMLVQILMLQSTTRTGVNAAELFFHSGVEVFINGVLGFGIMLLVMFLDYSFLGKHPLAVWMGILLVFVILSLLEMNFYSMQLNTTNISAITSLMTLFFAALVYFYRNKRYQGILLCLFWLVAGCFLLSHQMGISLTGVLCLFLTGVMIISFSVQKGWFGVPKGKGQLLLWSVWLLPVVSLVAALAAGAIGASYQTARIRAFLYPAGDPLGGGYMTLFIRNRLKGLQLVGSSLKEQENVWWYSLNYILERYGILMGVLVLAALGLLLGRMLSGVTKQQNRLGSLLGVGCVSYLAVTTLLHVLAALTLVPATSAYLPFFTRGRGATVGMYLLLGVYLSVHRNRFILSEKRNQPKKRLRLQLEDVHPN